jgi:DDE domain
MAFFRKAIKRQQHPPQTITLDGYGASHRAVRELKADGSLPTETKLRSSKYLNSLIEQDHRSIKQRVAVMLGFKKFRDTAIMIAGIELMHRIRKGTVRPAPPWCSGWICARNLERDTRSLKAAQRTRYACPRAARLHHNPSPIAVADTRR